MWLEIEALTNFEKHPTENEEREMGPFFPALRSHLPHLITTSRPKSDSLPAEAMG